MLALGGSEAPSQSAAPAGGARHQRLWAVLLVLDAFLVIIFGGALAAKIYQYLQAPAPIPAMAHRRLKPKEAAKPEAAKAEAPKPAEPAKAPAAANVAAAPDTTKPVPKPSLVQEAPKPHQAPAPKGPTASAAAAPRTTAAPAGKAKAVPVEFHLKAPSANRVELSGAFIIRGGGRKTMTQGSDGVWTVTVYLTPNTYRYRFVVDGRKILDPQNKATERGSSVVTVPQP